MKRAILAILLCIVTPCVAEPVLKPNDSLAICGDSITEQKLYSAFIEDYLLMCQPVRGVETMQFGWSGETSWGFVARMDCPSRSVGSGRAAGDPRPSVPR